MTDHLTPENKALVERVLGYGTARTYNRHEIDRIIDAAREEGRCSPGEGSDRAKVRHCASRACKEAGHCVTPDACNLAPFMKIDRDWFERKATLEGDYEIGAGISSPPPSGEVREAIPTRDFERMREALAHLPERREFIAEIDAYQVTMNGRVIALTACGDDAKMITSLIAHALQHLPALLALPTRDEAALPEAVETVDRYGDAIDASRRIHDWINAIAAADDGQVPSREIRNYTFNEDDGGAVLYFRNNRVAAGGFMVRDLHNFTVSMKVFAAPPPPPVGGLPGSEQGKSDA